MTAGLYETELLAFLEKQYGPLSTPLKIVVFFASLFLKSGHICLPLENSPEEWANLIELDWQKPDDLTDTDPETLLASPLVGKPSDDTLFVIDETKFYFRKQWVMEEELANEIQERVRLKSNRYDPEIVGKKIVGLFPGSGSGSSSQDRLKLASALSLKEKLLVITGWPGTGKTTAICKILALHSSLSDKPPGIALAAPTGKASARLTEALQTAIESGNLPDPSGRLSSLKAMTLHRLLSNWSDRGVVPLLNPFKLPYDLIIVDEASMVDLSMMHRLLTNASRETTILLLGDSDQLSSVQAGAVFSELCRHPDRRIHPDSISFLKSAGLSEGLGDVTSSPDSTLPIIRFMINYRTSGSPVLLEFARAVHEENIEKIRNLILTTPGKELSMTAFDYSGSLFCSMSDKRVEIVELCQQMEPADIFRIWGNDATFAALRNGPQGTVDINRKIESAIYSSRTVPTSENWYTGRPIIITRNDYNLGLFNGDRGICYLDENRTPWIYVQHTSDEFKRYPAGRLKHYEPAFVITVHKSQGSEYDNVTLLLPDEMSPVLSKELIYTAVTRARKSCIIRGKMNILEQSVKKSNVQYSALGKKIGRF